MLRRKAEVEQENFHFLGAFLRIEFDVQFAVAPGSAVERAASQPRVKFVQMRHQFQRRRAHGVQALALFVILKQRLPRTQFGLNFGVIGQAAAFFGHAQTARGAAFGKTVIGHAFFGHHAGGKGGNFAAGGAGSGRHCGGGR